MPHYFFLLDSAFFRQRVKPDLTASWRQRSFEPCRALCAELIPAARTLAERYHLGPEEPLLVRAADGLAFDRDFWSFLVGEILFYAAAEIPEIQTAPETLAFLLTSAQENSRYSPRESFTPIEQAHFGAHDLFLGRFYRPETVGINEDSDIPRLAEYLHSCRPEQWTTADLPPRPLATDEEEGLEELEFARQSLRVLQELYAGAAAKRLIVVCEAPD
jgi:hypothetical protein